MLTNRNKFVQLREKMFPPLERKTLATVTATPSDIGELKGKEIVA